MSVSKDLILTMYDVLYRYKMVTKVYHVWTFLAWVTYFFLLPNLNSYCYQQMLEETSSFKYKPIGFSPLFKWCVKIVLKPMALVSEIKTRQL